LVQSLWDRLQRLYLTASDATLSPFPGGRPQRSDLGEV
jgi:hypothetical protein